MAGLYDIKELLDKQSELIEVLGAKAKAFDYCLEAFESRYGDYVYEGEKLTMDLASGEKGYGMTRMCFENVTKTKLMREVICFMKTALEESAEENNVICTECECKEECDGIEYMSKDQCEKKRGWQ